MRRSDHHNARLSKASDHDVEGTERMVVMIRVRHLTEREHQLCTLRYPHRQHIGYSCVECASDDVIVFDPDSPVNRSCGRRYTFDRVFDGAASNEDVYTAAVQPLLGGLLDGYNGTCFAYGMTGAGKTYTMMGTDRVTGLCFMAVGDMFDRIKSSGGNCAVHASYLEIYNEKVKDLLSKDATKRHDIVEDPEKGVVVTDLAEYLVTNLQDLNTLMALGCEKRTKASTASNVVSSRSHAILLITVRRHSPEERVLSVGKLSLIDLAGSERALPGDSHAGARGARLQEGANINRSLLALGNCITILGAAPNAKGRERKHVPYRDSKLTRLLKDSLGGNTRTVMIGNISPASTCYEEVVSTLKYATRARNISRHITRNEVVIDPRVRGGGHPAIDALKTDIAQLRTQLVVQKCAEEGISRTQYLPPNAGGYFRPVSVATRPAVDIKPTTFAGLESIKDAVLACKKLQEELDVSVDSCPFDGHDSDHDSVKEADETVRQRDTSVSLVEADLGAQQRDDAHEDWQRVHDMLASGVAGEMEMEMGGGNGMHAAAAGGAGSSFRPVHFAPQERQQALPKWRTLEQKNTNTDRVLPKPGSWREREVWRKYGSWGFVG